MNFPTGASDRPLAARESVTSAERSPGGSTCPGCGGSVREAHAWIICVRLASGDPAHEVFVYDFYMTEPQAEVYARSWAGTRRKSMLQGSKVNAIFRVDARGAVVEQPK